MAEHDISRTLTTDKAARVPAHTRITSCLFVVLHADAPMTTSWRHALDELDEVELHRGSPVGATREEMGPGGIMRIAIADAWMSANHAVLQRRGDDWFIVDAGSKNGVFVNGERIDELLLEDGYLIEIGHTFLLFRKRVPLPVQAPRDLTVASIQPAAPFLTTLSEPLGSAFEALVRVAHSNIAVLVQGESGTGKEGIARAVHRLSARKGRFVAINCGAIPDSLIASELFGHRRGAFSGAHEDRAGLVRAADGGTLFLDEIADLPLSAQATLLRVLQENEVMPLGSTQATPVDLRVVAATHRDLDNAVAKGVFREDLLSRLSGYVMRLPPLRDRREDFGVIVRALLEKVAPARCDNIAFDPPAAQALLLHGWPNNVRELEQALAAALVVSEQGALRPEHFPRVKPAKKPDAMPERPLSAEDLARRAELEQLLKEYDGNVTAVARAMGKARMQIQRWMKRYGLRGE